MPVPDPLRPFIEPLERLDLPYCVTGSVAASIYGEPRLTADIDVVLLLRLQDVARLHIRFMLAASVIDREIIDHEVIRRGLQDEWQRCQR